METTIETTTAPEFSGRATYEPESNKLRLYVGRVPRAEYENLRAQGWTSTPKQSCDFVAHWTPDRRNTALEYAGIIEDEDQGPAERAADRAERFGDYRDKRTDEATGQADRYDAGPSAHGFQSQARAERSAARHDRVASRALDSWSKAEYWTTRTAGVISHALHVSTPGVRMGRIKELEAEIRKCEKSRADYVATREKWIAIAARTDPAFQNRAALIMAGGSSDYGTKYQHPRQPDKNPDSLWDLLHADRCNGDAITGAEAAALYLASHGELSAEGDWLTHYRLRLAYENQMMEAQGGRAGDVEMVAGGWLRGGRRLGSEERRIVKVNKSPATGRVVSVLVRDNRASTCNHWGNPFPDGIAKVLSHTVEVERMEPDAYRAPTAEELATFEASEKAAKKERKAAAPAPIPLVNPTDADAERLQAVWNKQSEGRRYGSEVPTVARITQVQYSDASKGSTSVETEEITGGGLKPKHSGGMHRPDCPIVAKVRSWGYRVVVLTDKPQKAFAPNVWHDPRPGIVAELAERFSELDAAVRVNYYDRTAEQTAIFNLGRIVGLTYCDSTSQYGYTEAGHKWAEMVKDQRRAVLA